MTRNENFVEHVDLIKLILSERTHCKKP